MDERRQGDARQGPDQQTTPASGIPQRWRLARRVTRGRPRRRRDGIRRAYVLLVVAAVVIVSAGVVVAVMGPFSGLIGVRARTSPPTSAGPSHPVSGALPQIPGQFVTTDGQQFEYRARPLPLYGFTFYPATAGGTAAWHQQTFPRYIDHMLALGQAAGQNLVRPTDFWNTTTPGQTWTDPTVWANMDYLLQAAQRHGMFVVLDVSAYQKILQSEGADPYDAANWTAYLQFVGARYRGATALAFYSVVGEPPPPTTPEATARLVAFYRAVTDTLHTADGGAHLITAGGFTHMENETASTQWWQQIYALPHNDVIAFKSYSQHDIDLLPKIAAYARQIGKPMADEEFGMPQYMGDTAATGSVYNGLTSSRAGFYQTVYEQGRSNSVAAFVFWNLGCQVGASSYEVSPLTPGVWQAVADASPLPKIHGDPSVSPC